MTDRGPTGLLWVRLPALAPARLPVVRATIADGSYLRAWPPAALAVPVVALLLGAVCGWRPWDSDGFFMVPVTYTSSITVMALFTVVGFTGAANGLWCVLGYGLADLLLHEHLAPYYLGTYLRNVLEVYPPLFLSYLLLAALVVLIPLLSTRMGRQLVARIRFERATRPPTILAAAASALIAALLVWSWTHTVPTLIRPIYTWTGGSPPTTAISPMQDYGFILILAAAVVTVARIALEDLALDHGTAPPPATRSVARRPWPVAVTVGLRTAVTTFVLSGLFTEYWHAAVFAAVFAASLILRATLARQSAWPRLVNRVPVVIRLAVAVGASYLVGSIVVDGMWRSTETFLPILMSVAVSLLLVSVLVPGRPPPRPGTAPGRRPDVAAGGPA
jgi:hypothetical protein